MINDLNILNDFRGKSNFQTTLVDQLRSLMKLVDLEVLHDVSFVVEDKSLLIISLVHILDTDTNLTINVDKEFCSIWYAGCNLWNGDIDESDILVDLFQSQYISYDYYYGNKMIYLDIEFLNPQFGHFNGRLTVSFFFKLYIELFKKKLEMIEHRYQPFI